MISLATAFYGLYKSFGVLVTVTTTTSRNVNYATGVTTPIEAPLTGVKMILAPRDLTLKEFENLRTLSRDEQLGIFGRTAPKRGDTVTVNSDDYFVKEIENVGNGQVHIAILGITK